MYSCMLSSNEVKARLVRDLFPSEEDGNPNDYNIAIEKNLMTEDWLVVLTLKGK